jgi:hypothetical protein
MDKLITARWVKNECTDTIIGAFLTTLEAAGLIIAAAFISMGTKFFNTLTPFRHVINHD